MTIIEGYWSRPCDPCWIGKGSILANKDLSKAVAVEPRHYALHGEASGPNGAGASVVGSTFIDGDSLDFWYAGSVYRCTPTKTIRAAAFRKIFGTVDLPVILKDGAFLLGLKEMKHTDEAIKENFVEIEKQLEALKQVIADLSLRLSVRSR